MDGKIQTVGLFVEINFELGKVKDVPTMFAENCNCEPRDRRIRSNESGLRATSSEGGCAAATTREEVRARTSRRACFR